MSPSKPIVDQLRNDVFFLSSDIGERNPTHYEKLEQAKEWIIESMKEYYPLPRQQTYEVDGKKFTNILFEKSGSDPSLGSLVIGAHYDTALGTPGADDNASAVAVMMALARHFSKEKTNHTLEFVAFTLEEPPNFRTENMGSMHLAKEWRAQNKNIGLMICLEMVGFFSDQKIQNFPVPGMGLFYPKKGNFIAAIGKTGSPSPVIHFVELLKKNDTLPVESMFAPSFLAGIDFSDHQSFWKYDYPALMITDTAFYRNPNYHHLTDTPNTLNYPLMDQLVQTLIKTIKAYDQETRFP